jgi:hypothetical protein
MVNHRRFQFILNSSCLSNSREIQRVTTKESFRMFKSLGVLVLTSSMAFAATPPAEMAGEMLARAQSVDIKCNYLKAADRDTLSSLVARAEIALANRESVEATKATMLRGHDDGKVATCNSTENEQVLNILNAAKQAGAANEAKPAAVAAATPQPAPIVVSVEPQPQQLPVLVVSEAKIADKPVVAVKIQEPVLLTKAKAKPMVKVAKLEQPKAKSLPAKADLTLGKYQAMTAQYYLASRCGSMPATQLGSFYKSIVSSHAQVMSTHSSAEVALALRLARSDASAHSCS